MRAAAWRQFHDAGRSPDTDQMERHSEGRKVAIRGTARR